MAKKTIGDCVSEVRSLLQDTVDPYRYPTADLYALFTNATYEIKRLRPDFYIGAYGQDLPIYTESDSATEVPFAMICFQPVVHFITGTAELRDDEFTVDNRAGVLLQAFTRQLTATLSARTG